MSCTADSKYQLKRSKDIEPLISYAVNRALNNLNRYIRNNHYYNLYVVYEKKILTSELNDFVSYSVNKYNLLNNTSYESISTWNESDGGIIPDGGCLWLKDYNDINFNIPLCISELKSQGTNDGRLKKGKREQAIGNAIERLGKYCQLFDTVFQYEKILPFITFIYGNDFSSDDKGEIFNNTIKMKLKHMSIEYNKLRLLNTQPHMLKKQPSIMVREDEWTITEMSDMIYSIALDSFNYFMNIT